MHRLNGEDSGFLALEQPTQPMTSQFEVHLQPPRLPDGSIQPITLEYLAEHVRGRLGRLTTFRWRVVPVPFGLHHETVIEDPDFAVEHHLKRVVVPAPGGPDEVARICDTLSSRRLDRSRPLWELVLIDGLADGHQVLVVRLHHALMDAVPTLLHLTNLLTAEGDDDTAVAPLPPWSAEPVPSRRQLLRQAVRDHRETTRRFPGLIATTWRSVRRQQAYERTVPFPLPKTGRDTPPTSLNDAFTARRRHANLVMALEEVMLVKQVSGATVTQVMLALTSGGLRRYLLDKGELPEEPLVAGVPMAFARPGEVRQWGNRFINFNTSLATDVADPWERLERVAAVAAAARRSIEIFDGEILCDWLDELPPFFTRWMVRRHLRSLQRNRHHADINVNVSVVRGPTARWALGPATVDRLYMEGPPNSGCGVSVTAYDRDDEMVVALHTCADAVPDPEVLARAFEASLAELVALALARTGARSGTGTGGMEEMAS